jgi:hypothetical protein
MGTPLVAVFFFALQHGSSYDDLWHKLSEKEKVYVERCVNDYPDLKRKISLLRFIDILSQEDTDSEPGSPS